MAPSQNCNYGALKRQLYLDFIIWTWKTMHQKILSSLTNVWSCKMFSLWFKKLKSLFTSCTGEDNSDTWISYSIRGRKSLTWLSGEITIQTEGAATTGSGKWEGKKPLKDFRLNVPYISQPVRRQKQTQKVTGVRRIYLMPKYKISEKN